MTRDQAKVLRGAREASRIPLSLAEVKRYHSSNRLALPHAEFQKGDDLLWQDVGPHLSVAIPLV